MRFIQLRIGGVELKQEGSIARNAGYSNDMYIKPSSAIQSSKVSHRWRLFFKLNLLIINFFYTFQDTQLAA